MIGILTPYSRCDTTAAAVRLADLGIALGEDVKLVACGKQETNVHPFWDGCVWSGKADGIYHGTKGCDVVLHFFAHTEVLSMSKLVAESAKHILIPPWHTLTPGMESLFKQYDKIVLHGKTYADYFRTTITDTNVTWCRWESGLPHVRRDGLVKTGKVRALFYCDNSTIDFCGPMIIELCNELLRALPKLEIGMMSTKSWSRKDRAELKKLASRYPARFEKIKAGNWSEQATTIHHFDWFVNPSVRSDFASAVTRALSCGAPVVANDIPPFDEILTPKHNGHLVACEVKTSGMRAPFAVPAFGKWLEVCQKAFANNQSLFSMQQRDWQMEYGQSTFNEFWSKILQ